MEAFKLYLLQNWVLLLVLGAFAIMLFTTSFLSKKARNRMLILVFTIFVLSITVFIEFYLEPCKENNLIKEILMSIRYSSTPFILALVIFALVKRQKAFVFIPAGLLLIINIISIFTGIVFSHNDAGNLVRGPLGFVPYVISGLYIVLLIWLLISNSNKRMIEIVPIIFFSFALISGVVFPFIFGAAYSQIFCSIMAIALFIYYVFLVLQLVKKDPLTGLLNRQTYYGDIERSEKDINAIISLDMNGLKMVNDTYGHAEGDEALISLAICFTKACGPRQSAYRLGGDEFAIVCKKTSEEDVKKLINKIEKYVSETKYTVSIGYCYQHEGFDKPDDLLKESDKRMYDNKAEFYKHINN